MASVYVRDFETRSVVKEIKVDNMVGTSNYDRFLMGLLHNMNLDKYYVDESEVEDDD
ncbi:hypothetical protein LCGC14_0561150 [marine sediment metagenome]|uniref:Uncharacterized protein n=1 Tax=marine sediment metagenome TaxID=412755 RepID=A0A0F9RS64_9ZZZZ